MNHTDTESVVVNFIDGDLYSSSVNTGFKTVGKYDDKIGYYEELVKAIGSRYDTLYSNLIVSIFKQTSRDDSIKWDYVKGSDGLRYAIAYFGDKVIKSENGYETDMLEAKMDVISQIVSDYVVSAKMECINKD